VRYVYRTIDQFGRVVDVLVSPRRSLRAARRFLAAIGTTSTMPSEVVTDEAPTYPVVLEELLQAGRDRTISMPTTTSRPTTAVSSRGCVRCVGSSRAAAPRS